MPSIKEIATTAAIALAAMAILNRGAPKLAQQVGLTGSYPGKPA